MVGDTRPRGFIHNIVGKGARRSNRIFDCFDHCFDRQQACLNNFTLFELAVFIVLCHYNIYQINIHLPLALAQRSFDTSRLISR